MDIFGESNDGGNPFNQDLNTTDAADFTRVDVTDAIVDNTQLATKLYVDTNSGGGDMNYTGLTPATDYIYKASGASGLDAVQSSITDNGSFVISANIFKCPSITKNVDSSHFEVGDGQITVDIMASNGLTSNKVVVNAGTNQQYMMADGSLLEASAQNGNANFYLYNNINGISVPPPANGYVSYNATTLALTTIVYISHLTRDSVDIDVYLALINVLDDLYIQDQTNSANFAKFNITSAPTLVPNSYISVPVAQVQYGGNGNVAFGSNHDILVSFFSNLQEINTRLTALENKTQNQSAIPLVTTFNQQIDTAILRVQAIASQTVSVFDKVTIGTGNNYAEITSSLGLISKNFVVLNATANQFLKGDGTLDSSTYVSNPTDTLGVNRLNNALTILPMTSDVLPAGYVASSSGFYSNLNPYKAFDGVGYFQTTLNNYNGATGVYVGVNTTSVNAIGNVLGDWIQIELPYVINLASYRITNANGATQRSPSTFYFLYSSNGTTWDIADTRTLYQWVSPYDTTFTLASVVTARYFRISCSVTGNTGVVVNRNCFDINQLYFIQQTTNTVQCPTMLSNKTAFTNSYELVSKSYVDTYATTIIQGMPFNSLFGNTTTASTGTRSLMYFGMAPYATLINGITLYIDGGGSDPCHFGIYRGYLKSGVGTNPGLNMTLVGQSANGVLLTTTIPFNRVPIVAVSGQNLNFTAGEFMTIAFHTSGSSNTFLSSPTAGTSFVNLSYTILTNYASTNFPATLTNSVISSGTTQRICFDLY